MARHLTLVPAPRRRGPRCSPPSTRRARLPRRRRARSPCCRPGPPAAVDAARAVLRPDEPLEPGADLVVVTSGSTGGGRGVLLSAAAARGPRRRPPSTGSAARATGCSRCRSRRSPACRCSAAACWPAGRPTVLARGEPLADAVARMPRRRPPVHRAGAHPAAPLPRRRARRAARLRRGPGRRRRHRPGAAATAPARAGVAVVTTYGMTETAGGCVYDGAPAGRRRGSGSTDGGVRAGRPGAGARLPAGPGGDRRGVRRRLVPHPRRRRARPDGRLTVHRPAGRRRDHRRGQRRAGRRSRRRCASTPTSPTPSSSAGPDDEWGQRVVAAVVPAAGAVPDLAALRAWVAEPARRPRRAARAAPASTRSRRCTPASPTAARRRRAARPGRRPDLATPAQWLAGARPRTLPAARRARARRHRRRRRARRLPARARRCSRCVVALALQVAVNYANDYSDGRRGTDADRVGPMRLVGSGAATAAPGAASPPALAFAVAGARRAGAGRAVELVAGRRRRGLHRRGLDLHRRPAPLRLPGAGRGVRLRLLRPGRRRRDDVRADPHAARAGVRRRGARSGC